MTERGLPIVDGAPACPFVAFDDDRDERARSPDHRHRCYAEVHPAPRALAHQEAYCLSSAFPVCPTFQDWARREAARTRGGPPPSPVGPAVEPTEDEPAVIAPEEEPDEVAQPPDLPPRRNPPRRWTAPPPWAADERHDQPVDPDLEPSPVGFEPGRTRPEQGLVGSPADRMAGGSRGDERSRGDAWGWGEQTDPSAGPWNRPEPGARRDDAELDQDDDDREPEERPRPRVARSAGIGLPLGDRRPRVGQARPRRPVSDDGGPSWERPRRYEAYPALRTRVGLPSVSVPPLGLAAVAILVAALALFFLPALLGIGSPPGGSGGSPSATVGSSASPSGPVSPTPVPSPTPRVYVVAPGDTLSQIARRFDLSVDQVLAANPQITNPNRIAVGDEIIIPDAQGAAPSVIEGESPSPSA
ncbi:MAG TPA: LysM domain-containing protein [Candidatus Limnocylindrales bacterium]|jgi:LysM repeat protein